VGVISCRITVRVQGPVSRILIFQEKKNEHSYFDPSRSNAAD
jgi:hypothetical protein